MNLRKNDIVLPLIYAMTLATRYKQQNNKKVQRKTSNLIVADKWSRVQKRYALGEETILARHDTIINTCQ
jgi:hypothetical protein